MRRQIRPGLAQAVVKAQAHVGKSVGRSRRGVVIEEVVRDRKTKLSFVGDSKSHGCFWEIKGALAPVTGLLKSILKLQAPTGNDDARTCDLRPVCGNRGLRIGAASLSLRQESESSRRDRRSSTKVDRNMHKIVKERFWF